MFGAAGGKSRNLYGFKYNRMTARRGKYWPKINLKFIKYAAATALLSN